MTSQEIKEYFDSVFNGSKNFMTPEIVKYGKRDSYLYEISAGYGFNHERIYGVTVLYLENGEATKTQLSHGCFKSVSEAESYIENNIE